MGEGGFRIGAVSRVIPFRWGGGGSVLQGIQTLLPRQMFFAHSLPFKQLIILNYNLPQT
jgi:hypothetical protein